jgi:hypothetical protein
MEPPVPLSAAVTTVFASAQPFMSSQFRFHVMMPPKGTSSATSACTCHKPTTVGSAHSPTNIPCDWAEAQLQCTTMHLSS